MTGNKLYVSFICTAIGCMLLGVAMGFAFAGDDDHTCVESVQEVRVIDVNDAKNLMQLVHNTHMDEVQALEYAVEMESYFTHGTCEYCRAEWLASAGK